MTYLNIKRVLLTLGFIHACILCNAQVDTTSASPKPDILDSFIAITIILFIISVIIEKITQLIRKYSPFIKPHYNKDVRKSLGTVWRNINNKQTGNNPDLDRKIEREVNSLSLIIGIIVALAFRVDLFKMFKEPDPRDVLFWSGSVTYSTLEIWLFAFSIALTGFFLTFGSKFFHDLLDTLFQVKNLKRKIADDTSFKAENIEQFDEFISKSSASIINTAIEQNRSLFISPEMIGPPMRGKMMKAGKLVDCIDVHLSGNDRGQIPFAVQAKLEKGQVITVPVKVIMGVDIPQAHFQQGDTVASASSAEFKGTICCKVKRNADNRVALLTCSHVMTNGSSRNFFGTLKKEVPAKINGETIGAFFWAVCNDMYDLALVDPKEDTFQYSIVPAKERSITASDILTTDIKVVRQQGRGISEGKIVNDRSADPIQVNYAEGKFSLVNLILLSKVAFTEDEMSFSALTAPGDSGACVYDSQNKPIGMIIAGNTKFSYAISLTDILIQAEASIIT